MKAKCNIKQKQQKNGNIMCVGVFLFFSLKEISMQKGYCPNKMEEKKNVKLLLK
jgi:hypothetical protein